MIFKSEMPAISAVEIRRCRACGSGRFVNVLSLGNQHISDFVTSKGDSPRSPLKLVRCEDCDLVQLKHTFPRQSLYLHYWYRSGISSTMKAALRDVVVRTSEVAKPQAGELVLDIGCNDGTLLRSYEIPGLRLIGFEPAKNLVEDARRETEYIFNDFFSSDLFQKQFPNSRAKIITSIAMFYDLDKPSDFVADIVECLDTHGVWVVQQNYLCSMLRQNGFDNIGHEHLTYYSLKTMSQLLGKHEMEIFDAEINEVNGGSFRTYIAHRSQFPIQKSVGLLEKEEELMFSRRPSIYTTFAQKVRSIRSTLHNFVETEVAHGKSFYVYGASTRGNTILQYCGLDETLMTKATDANPEKWGRRTPGSLIPIVSKEEARKDNPDYFLILPHHFLEEIKRDEQAYLRRGGKFIVPLPFPRIVTRGETVPL